jgi:hypothetical protein
MYVSRLTFHTAPGKTRDVEHALHTLLTLVDQVGGGRPRILRNHFASQGAPDVVFEQDAPDLETLETQIRQVTERADFQQWSQQMAELLAQSPKREVYLAVEAHPHAGHA